MKKFIILIFTNLTVASGLAMEPLDTMWLKITYHVSLKDFVEREKGRESNAVLEIGKTAFRDWENSIIILQSRV